MRKLAKGRLIRFKKKMRALLARNALGQRFGRGQLFLALPKGGPLLPDGPLFSNLSKKKPARLKVDVKKVLFLEDRKSKLMENYR